MRIQEQRTNLEQVDFLHKVTKRWPQTLSVMALTRKLQKLLKKSGLPNVVAAGEGSEIQLKI